MLLYSMTRRISEIHFYFRRVEVTFSLLRIRKYGASEKVTSTLRNIFSTKNRTKMERKRIRNWVFEVGHDDGFSQRPDRSMGFAEKLRISPVYHFLKKKKPLAAMLLTARGGYCENTTTREYYSSRNAHWRLGGCYGRVLPYCVWVPPQI